MISILGAGGAIGGELAKLLAASNQPYRLVGRNPRGAPGATETVAAEHPPERSRRRRARAFLASDDENQERKDRVGSKARPMEPHGAQ